MTKTDLILGGGIVGTGTIVLLFIAPVETLIVIAVALGVGGVTLAFLQWFGVLGPLYVQTTLAAQIAQAEHAGAKVVVLDIPLLVESAYWRAQVDAILVVDDF